MRGQAIAHPIRRRRNRHMVDVRRSSVRNERLSGQAAPKSGRQFRTHCCRRHFSDRAAAPLRKLPFANQAEKSLPRDCGRSGLVRSDQQGRAAGRLLPKAAYSRCRPRAVDRQRPLPSRESSASRYFDTSVPTVNQPKDGLTLSVWCRVGSRRGPGDACGQEAAIQLHLDQIPPKPGQRDDAPRPQVNGLRQGPGDACA
jgi:hypothetical protein